MNNPSLILDFSFIILEISKKKIRGKWEMRKSQKDTVVKTHSSRVVQLLLKTEQVADYLLEQLHGVEMDEKWFRELTAQLLKLVQLIEKIVEMNEKLGVEAAGKEPDIPYNLTVIRKYLCKIAP
jgi:hypothetical protein